MSQRAYRMANSGMLSCLGVSALGLVATAVLSAVMHYVPGLYELLGGWWIPILVLPIPIALVFAGRRYARLDRERIAQLAPVCSTLGFRLVVASSSQQRAAYYAPLAVLEEPLTLREGAARLVWWAEGNSEGHAERLFEHEYSLGSGKTTVTYPHTVLAWPWTDLRLPSRFAQEGANFSVARHAGLLRGSSIPHGRTLHKLEGAGSTWAGDGEREAAARFLTSAVRAELEAAPREEWWHVGQGWICCVFVGKLDAANLANFVAHARTVLAAGA